MPETGIPPIFGGVQRDCMKTAIMKTDSLLIIQLNAGSKKAFSALYDKYAGMVYGYAYSMLKDKILAEDITQFCFMQLWEHKETVSAYKNLPAWLYVTARNAIYKETRQQIVATKYIDFATETFERYQMATDGNIDYMLIIKEIEKFIASLPETRRKAFMMKAFQDKSVKEIADTMSISPKTVETHIHRAYTALRAAVAKLAFAVACLFITSL